MKKIFFALLCLMLGLSAQSLPNPADIFRQPAFYGNTPCSIAWSPGDSVVAFVWSKEGEPNGDIWLAKVPSGTLRQLTHFNDVNSGHIIEELQWFPDEQRLLFIRKGDIFTIRPATQQEPVTLSETPSCELAPRISPTGRYVSFIRDNTLRLIDIKEGREIQLSEMPDADWNSISRYCRDNRYTLYHWASDESALIIPAYQEHFARELYCFDLINQETRIVTIADNEQMLIRDILWIADKNRLAVDCLGAKLKTRNIILIDLESPHIDTVYTCDNDLWCSNFGGKLSWLTSEQKLLYGDIQNGYQHIYWVDAKVIDELRPENKD